MPEERKKGGKTEEEKGKAAGARAGGETVTVSKEMLFMLVAVFVLMAAMIALLVLFPGTGGSAQRVVAQANAGNQTPIVPVMSVGYGSLPLRGNAGAPVALIEFGDFQCAYCEKFYSGAEADIIREYVDTGKVRIYFRDVPLGIYDKALDAALTARCANEQGKFWEMHDILYGKRAEWAPIAESGVAGTFASYANETGLDMQEFAACYGNATYAADIQKDKNEAAALGITATPKFALIIPKSRVSGFEAEFSSIRSSLPPQMYATMRLAQDNGNYIIIIEGNQPIDTFRAIFDTVSYQ